MPPITFRLAAALALTFLLASCAGVAELRPGSDAPSQIQLLRPCSFATMHFPAGIYSQYANDDRGWYYSAPRQVIEHSWTTQIPRNGGIFLSRRSDRRPRAFVMWYGELTKLGTFSRRDLRFR